MNPLQFEIIAQWRRETLLREAELDRLARLLGEADTTKLESDPRPQRRGLAMLWPRLATQAS